MNKAEEIKRLWSDAFGYPNDYIVTYMDRIYRDADALVIADDYSHIISCLLLQRYLLWFRGHELPISYISKSATRRNMRGRGYMARLVTTALRESASRGDVLCCLNPTHDWLYFYYDQFGFSTTFYADVQRFTALHSFPVRENYFVVDDPYSEEMYGAFARFEHSRKGMVLHSRRDFLNILDDISLRPGGTFVAVGRKDCGLSAMAWASLEQGGILRVKELFGVDSDARTGVLHELRKRFEGHPVVVEAPADTHGSRHLYARGMARIVNVEPLLKAMAEANTEWNCSIKVHDTLLQHNNHTYIIKDGQCAIDDAFRSPLDFNIYIPVLNSLVFSSSEVGGITGVPSERIHMSLMSD